MTTDSSNRSDCVGASDPALAELIEISHEAGADPDLVQGGGGNTSVKTGDGETMFVKASGVELADVDARRGWAELDLARARGLLAHEELERLEESAREARVLSLLSGAVKRPEGARPSVESSLHAILDRVVIHTHPVGLNALLCSKRSRELCWELLEGRTEPFLYVPYVDPGFTLAARLDEEVRRHRRHAGRAPAVVLLENHGLFVAAPQVERCLRLTRELARIGREWIGGERINPLEEEDLTAGDDALARRLRAALERAGGERCLAGRDRSPIAADLLEDARAVDAAKEGAFTPDQIVYCRTRPLVTASSPADDDLERELRSYRSRYRLDPRVVIVPREGIVYLAPSRAQLRVVAQVYRGAVVTLTRTAPAGGPRFLSAEQAGFIERWEVESYRAALLAESSGET